MDTNYAEGAKSLVRRVAMLILFQNDAARDTFVNRVNSRIGRLKWILEESRGTGRYSAKSVILGVRESVTCENPQDDRAAAQMHLALRAIDEFRRNGALKIHVNGKLEINPDFRVNIEVLPLRLLREFVADEAPAGDADNGARVDAHVIVNAV